MTDPLLNTARRVAGAAFEIIGELGRSGDERVAYLARESPTGELVALTLEGVSAAEAQGTDPSCAVRRALDTSVPASGHECPACSAVTETWARYCASCGYDLSGGPPPVENENTGRMLAQTAARGRFELLGDMARSEGGSPVYFGREETTGRLVALRLEPMDDPEAPVPFTLSVAQQIGVVDQSDPPAGAQAEPKEDELAESTRVYVCPLCEEQYPAGTFFCPRDGTALRPKVRTQDLVGQTVAGRYRIVERLGQGGMGQVYKAVHVRMGSHCAIKIMNPALETDPEALGRFAREATLASRIEHANVARVYDFGETQNGLLFLAMEFVEGESLSTLISDEGPLEPARAAELAWQVADALAVAHDLGTIHRDIKPDNIIVNTSRADRETATVVDFGIAKGIEVSDDEQVTRAGFVVGNPKYMSPEQLIGETTDARGDVYSLGCVLYEMLVGESAFSGATGAALLTQRLTEPAPSPRSKLSTVPQELDEIVTRALAREREDRFASAIEMRDALDDYIATTVTASRRVRTDRQRALKPTPAAPPDPSPAPAPEASSPVAPPAPARPKKAKPGKAMPEKAKQEKPKPEKAKPEKAKPSGPRPVRAGKPPGPGAGKPIRPLLAAGAAVVAIVLAVVFWPRGGPTPEPGTLVIQGALPVGASITARDEAGNVATIEGETIQLAGGTYRLFFTAPDHEPDQADIVVEPGTRAAWRPRVIAIQVAAADDTTDVVDVGEGAEEGAGRAGGQATTGGGREQAARPTWTAARADSVSALIAQAAVRVGRGQYANALTILGQAETRVTRLRSLFPTEGALNGLSRRIGMLRDSIDVLQRPPAPSFNQASADSVRNLLTRADVRAERKEYEQAFELLNQATTRLSALRAAFPNEPALDALYREAADVTTRTRTTCEAWREIQLERGLPAPDCR